MNAHHHTPTLSVIDSRALTIRSVGYCRHPDKLAIEPCITRQVFDAAGRLHESWDPRLWGTAPKANLCTVHGLNGQPLLTDSVDAGWQLSLLDQTGLPCSFWDARGSQRHTDHDNQQRPIRVTEQVAAEPPRVVERLTYGGSTEIFIQHNQCGRLIRHDDPAGSQCCVDYGLAGSALVEERRFLTDLEIPDWPDEPELREAWLEDQSFATRHVFHPTGDIQRQTDAMGNVRTFGYDLAGKLSETWLLLAGPDKQPQRLVSDIQYNAYGQIESETAGNGVVTRADYSADDGRLIRLMAQVGDQKPLQDLHYRYDPVGNIVELEDKSQAVTYFNNQRIDPINRYRYDSLYQLVEARGWEVCTPSHGPALPDLLPTPLDPNQRRNYTQHFDYDPAGNLITRRHSGAPGFSMFTSATCNRSLAQRDDGTLPGEPDIASGFDACGNQLELQRGQTMLWDMRNQLSRVTLVQREDDADDYEWYAYDRPGHRLRKVFFSKTNRRTLRAEIRYLPGLEIHRQTDGEVRHVISAEVGRCSLRALHWPEGAHADQLRYSLGDHLGSSTLELDDEAGVLTQEYYYAFGGTACWASKSVVVAKYKSIRYSGKERDATGLYYYGYRYYAPWLQRWINPDPAGDEDGPNRYKMVSNNPINLIDRFGLQGEQSFVSGLLAASALASLLVAGGFGLGSLADYGDEGAMVGAAVGAAVLALFLGTVVEEWWLAYQQSRPEVIAAEEQEFLKALKAQHRETADEYGLTEDEGVRFSNFVLEQIQSHGDIHTSFALHETDAGHIFAYVGPSTTAGQAVDALSSTKPGNKLNDLGHKTLLVRSAPGAHSSPALGGTITGQFESENFVSVAGQPKGGGTSQPGPGVIQPHSAGPAPAQKMVIDTEALSGILKNVSDSDRRVVESAIDKLLDGRLPANHWKRYGNKMFAVDLPGYGGGKRRGTHRLMFSRQENSRYKVEEIRKTH